MPERETLAIRFNDLCRRILEHEGYAVGPRVVGERGFDFRVVRPDNTLELVEIKVYRSKYVPTPWLWSAGASLQRACERVEAQGGLLICTSRVTAYTRDNIQSSSPLVRVYDPGDLARVASSNAILYYELQSLLREALGTAPEPQSTFQRWFDANLSRSFAFEFFERPQEAQESPASIPLQESGSDICNELHAVTEGKEGYREFERVGEKALRYLFKDDFSFFKPQKVLDDLQRTDVLAKLAPTVDFWKEIARDFRTRYVVFEFKNYVEKIGTSEIYTTEKYLFTTALRSVAVVVARNGATDRALDAAKGALRETGKLILVVSLADICDMLARRDNDDDPSDVLSDALDEMLTTITR